MILQASIRHTFGRKSVESGAHEKVIEMSHRLDPYFTTETLIFVSNSGEPLVREFPCVKDTNDFVTYIHDVMGLSFHDTLLKVGIDGGGGFLKFCLLAMERSALEQVHILLF